MNRKRKALWWSSMNMYYNCPKQFQYKYGSPGVEPTKPPPRSEHHILMGVVIQAVVEDFYNQQLWLSDGAPRPTADLVKILIALTKNKFQHKLRKFHIDWSKSDDEGELLDTCIRGVLGYLRTMKENLLIGEENVCEQRIVVDMGDFAIGAKPDLIVKRTTGEASGISIIDGKNSKSGESDPDQLRLYALIFYRKYGIVPNRLGFAWYRYPSGSEMPNGEPSTGVTWISCDKDDLDGLAARCATVHEGITAQKFPANPVPKYCKWCDWESLCAERQKQRAENAAKRSKNPKPPPKGESIGGAFISLEMEDE